MSDVTELLHETARLREQVNALSTRLDVPFIAQVAAMIEAKIEATNDTRFASVETTFTEQMESALDTLVVELNQRETARDECAAASLTSIKEELFEELQRLEAARDERLQESLATLLDAVGASLQERVSAELQKSAAAFDAHLQREETLEQTAIAAVDKVNATIVALAIPLQLSIDALRQDLTLLRRTLNGTLLQTNVLDHVARLAGQHIANRFDLVVADITALKDALIQDP